MTVTDNRAQMLSPKYGGVDEERKKHAHVVSSWKTSVMQPDHHIVEAVRQQPPGFCLTEHTGSFRGCQQTIFNTVGDLSGLPRDQIDWDQN